MAYYRQRMRQMSIAEYAVPSERIQKRERELRRSIMALIQELRIRSETASRGARSSYRKISTVAASEVQVNHRVKWSCWPMITT